MSYILSTKYARKEDSEFVIACARAIYCDHYVSWLEESCRGYPSGCELTEICPETQRWAFIKAREFASAVFAADFTSQNPGMTLAQNTDLSYWGEKTIERWQELAGAKEHSGDREPTAENLGWYAAMQAMGHGVGMECCGVTLEYRLPYLDSMPTMSPKEIANKRARDPEYDKLWRDIEARKAVDTAK